jgi:hypothetical protein
VELSKWEKVIGFVLGLLGTGAVGTWVGHWLTRKKTQAEAIKAIAEGKKADAEGKKADAEGSLAEANAEKLRSELTEKVLRLVHESHEKLEDQVKLLTKEVERWKAEVDLERAASAELNRRWEQKWLVNEERWKQQQLENERRWQEEREKLQHAIERNSEEMQKGSTERHSLRNFLNTVQYQMKVNSMQMQANEKMQQTAHEMHEATQQLLRDIQGSFERMEGNGPQLEIVLQPENGNQEEI